MSKFYTEKEVAEMLRCSLSKLRSDRWKRRGLPFYKNGRNVIYRDDDVASFPRRIEPQATTAGFDR